MTIQQLAELQALLQTRVPSATIAGGAVRDTLLSRPVKDIDVFVTLDRSEEDWSDTEPMRLRVAQLQALFPGATSTVTSESSYVSGEEEVYATYEIHGAGGLPLNVIFVSNFYAALNEFPDTISQAYILDGEAATSAAFDLSKDSLIIQTRLPLDDKRNVRLMPKFSDFTWDVVPALDYWE